MIISTHLIFFIIIFSRFFHIYKNKYNEIYKINKYFIIWILDLIHKYLFINIVIFFQGNTYIKKKIQESLFNKIINPKKKELNLELHINLQHF